MKKILIIDDNRELTDAVMADLTERGFAVEVASDGEPGFEKACLYKPDAILLDIMMPGWNGITTANRLQRNPDTADIPIIFLTGIGEDSNTVKFLEKWNYYILSKPFRMDQLLAILSNDLGM